MSLSVHFGRISSIEYPVSSRKSRVIKGESEKVESEKRRIFRFDLSDSPLFRQNLLDSTFQTHLFQTQDSTFQTRLFLTRLFRLDVRVFGLNTRLVPLDSWLLRLDTRYSTLDFKWPSMSLQFPCRLKLQRPTVSTAHKSGSVKQRSPWPFCVRDEANRPERQLSSEGSRT